MDKTLQALELIAQSMGQANIAIPIIFSTVTAIVHIIKGATGSGPTLLEVADMMEKQIDANDAFGKAEIERLRAGAHQ